jgi:hypothetical protein
MYTNFAFLCDAASQGADGKLHALGIGISQIRAQQVPAQHPKLALAAEIAYAPDEAGPKALAIRLIDADGGNIIPPIDGQLVFGPAEGTLTPVAHIVVELNMITFPKYGRYSVELSVGGESAASMPLEVLPAPQAGA